MLAITSTTEVANMFLLMLVVQVAIPATLALTLLVFYLYGFTLTGQLLQIDRTTGAATCLDLLT